MKRLKSIFLPVFLCLCALVAASCTHKPEPREKTSVLIYIAGNNSLSWNAPDCMSQLRSGFIPSGSVDSDLLLVYYHVPDECPKLIKLSRDPEGAILETVLCSYPSDQNSAKVETLKQVIMDAESLCPAQHHNLVLWSHSSGFLPKGYYEKLSANINIDKVYSTYRREPYLRKTFGKDYSSDDEIEIADLVAALPFKYDCIFFDSCHMGCVEVAYEFRDKCDYLVISPTEIMAQGFPYYMMMDEIFNNPDQEAAIKAVAKEYYDYYVKQYGGGTMTVVRSVAMDRLASCCASIIKNHHEALMSLDPGSIQVFDRCSCHWLFDLGDIVHSVSTPEEYADFQEAMSDAIAYKAATESFLQIRINKFSGFGMYLPNPEYIVLNRYYKTLLWNKETDLVW